MTALLLFLLFVLVLVNGFFVAAEFGLVRVRRATLEGDGGKKSSMALKQIKSIDRYLAACQLGITMASIAIGFLGEPALATLLEPALGSFLGHGAAITIAFLLSYVIVTALHITVGEQVPKIWAIGEPGKAARASSYPLEWFSIVFRPAVVVLSWISSKILWLVGIRGISGEEVMGSAELRSIISSAGDIEEAQMLSGVFHLHEQTAKEVMTPIPSVVSVRHEGSVREALQAAADSGRSRLLVQNEEGRVEGIVLVSRLIEKTLRRGEDGGIDELVQQPLYVPEGKPLDELFYDLQESKVSLAVVLDEYGSPVGICTAEDIVEEAVGEIRDENDTIELVSLLPGGGWLVNGETPLGDLKDFGIGISADEKVNSIGGLVFFRLGRLPMEGDSVQQGDYSIEVKEMADSRVVAVKITLLS